MTAISSPGRARPVTPVAILAQRLDALAQQAQAGPADLVAELTELRDLAAGLDAYVERHTSPPSPELTRLAAATADHDWTRHGGREGLEQEMLSGHVEGQFLRMITSAVGARRVLDIGMFTGYSALAMAEALPPGGVVVACEVDPGVAQIARETFDTSPAGNRVEIRLGPADRTLVELSRERARFDLVFLDADKAGYSEYLRMVIDGGLLTDRGLVLVDNTLMQGLPWTRPASTANATAIAGFNETVSADPRLEHVLVPLRDGITLIRRVPSSTKEK